jgi:hypothetical protein
MSFIKPLINYELLTEASLAVASMQEKIAAPHNAAVACVMHPHFALLAADNMHAPAQAHDIDLIVSIADLDNSLPPK